MKRSWRRVVSGALAVGALPLVMTVAVSSQTVATAAAGSSGHTRVLTVGGTGSTPSDSSCGLGNGVQHVVQITFDNVHFFRDNPNVPSDLEMMPHLLSFIEKNGTMMSNNHTPLIAHTTDDVLTTLTGLYGDRHGMPISNSYRSYNSDGSTDPAGSFAYWTDPVFDTAKTPNPGHDTNPSMVYSPTPPATTSPAPAPEHDHAGPVGTVHPGRLRRGSGFDREHRARELRPSTFPKVFGSRLA